ncbi:DUF3052 domain-containing protein [Maribacter halichondriae]|uniref:DUF3052 domain-containing protein n=1 Tax=Maribacter halichondriae TaxID=2980554 RepID=UPI0023595E78|nr:DUF3052 domain-containing protein [Maribacter sp. Hal144]
MSMTLSGYSGTPLVKKLGIKEGFQVLFVNEPGRYQELLIDCPSINFSESEKSETIDFIHLFCTEIVRFEEVSLRVKPLLKKNGILWVSWPKGSSKIETDLSRDYIRIYLLNNGLVDVKVCAIDSEWSGLKFVYRVKDRK